jgi:hypothetical protein
VIARKLLAYKVKMRKEVEKKVKGLISQGYANGFDI